MQYIVIEGNIGAGKTTLAGMLARDCNARLVLEQFADNPFLPKFYSEPDRYSFPLELAFLAERYRQLNTNVYQPELFNSVTIADYYFVKSLIFARITLHGDEFALYRQLFDIIMQRLPLPSLYVYLHSPVERLLRNIATRGRDYEQNITANYLADIQQSRRIIAPAVMGNQYGTYWYYERARGQYAQEQAKLTKNEKERFLRRNPKNQMFTKTDLAKVYNLYRQLPHQVSRGAQKNFISFAEWASEAWDKDPSVFNDLFFKKIVCLNILFKKLDHIVFCAPWYEKGYKAQIVSYALAYFFYQIGRECPDKVFDFKYVWNQQSISHETEIALGVIAEKMFYHLTSPKREVDNVTEWAKRESCWKTAKEISIPFSEQFKAELNYKSLEKEASNQARKEQKEQDSASAMIRVAEYGAENWKKVLDWGVANRIYSAKEISLLKTATSMNSKFPSEKQCVQILKILDKAREESYPE